MQQQQIVSSQGPATPNSQTSDPWTTTTPVLAMLMTLAAKTVHAVDVDQALQIAEAVRERKNIWA